MRGLKTLVCAGAVLLFAVGSAYAANMDDLGVTIRMINSDEMKDVSRELHLPDVAAELAREHAQEREGKGLSKANEARDHDAHEDTKSGQDEIKDVHDEVKDSQDEMKDDQTEVHQEVKDDQSEMSEDTKESQQELKQEQPEVQDEITDTQSDTKDSMEEIQSDTQSPAGGP
jgi:hypothetical protein